jgi:hypothetical protein
MNFRFTINEKNKEEEEKKTHKMCATILIQISINLNTVNNMKKIT